MNVLVVGATGATGRRILPKLETAEHRVTALVRRPEALAGRAGLILVPGDARDRAAVVRALAGQQAVLSALGPRSLKPDDLQETWMRNLLAGMVQNGVRRLVNLSAWGSLATRDSVPWAFKIIRGTLLRGVYQDKDRGEALLLASNFDYINVSPGRLTDGPERGAIKVSLDGQGVGASISRGDLAQFMVDQLTSDTWLRKSPIIGY